MNSDKNIDNPIRLTIHACERARQRYRWNSQTLSRMAIKAFETGLKRKNTKGYLKIYLDKSWEKYSKNPNFRLHGEIIFVFCNNKLVTLWPLPAKLRPLAKVFRQKHQEAITSI